MYQSYFKIPLGKIPQAKSWKVGGRYKIVAEVEQTGVNKEKVYSDLGVALEKRTKEKPREETIVEFRVVGVSPKDDALKKRY